jgi:hypothetical protein
MATFVISRLVYRLLGVRFDSAFIEGAWQFIDPNLLAHRPIESLWFLHTQPPGFNAFLAAVLWLPGDAHAYFVAAYLILGVVLTACMFKLLFRVTNSAVAAFVLTTVFVASPAVVLYENWLFYTYFEIVGLIVAALLVARYAETGSLGHGAALFAVLAGLAVTRSLYHLVWLLGTAVILWALRCGPRRITIGCAAAAMVLVGGVYAKNLVLYGDFTASTWMGPSLARITTLQLSETERQAMIRRGEISPLAMHLSFAPYEAFRGVALPIPKRPSAQTPLLDSPSKANGGPNFNYRGYLPLYRQYLKDSLTVIRSHPEAWLKGQSKAWSLYFYAADEYFFTQANRHRLRPVADLYRFVSLQARRAPAEFTPERGRWDLAEHSLLAMLGFGLVVVGGPLTLVRMRKESKLRTPNGAVLAFCVFTVAFVAFGSNAIEVGENNRLRFPTDALTVIAASGVAVTAINSERLRFRRSGASEPVLSHGA